MRTHLPTARQRGFAGALGIAVAGFFLVAGPFTACGGGDVTDIRRSGDGSSNRGGNANQGGSNGKAGAASEGAGAGAGGLGGNGVGGGGPNPGGGSAAGGYEGFDDEGVGGSPPLVLPACGDGVCDHDANEVCETCPSDCGACATCGNGVCEKGDGAAAEACDTCVEDCGVCSGCGDGVCGENSGETCTTCAADCGKCPTCGDGTCGDEENCDACAADCGACKPCGNGQCDPGETCGTCDVDCGACKTCGDGKCLGDETPATCAKDCGPLVPNGCITGDFKPFWGGVHAHTAVSDGKGSPGEAFRHASREAKPPLDFLYLSDHHNQIRPAEWDNCVTQANKYNQDGKFVAGCGYEKTAFADGGKDGIGHFNFLFPKRLIRNISYALPAIYNEIDDCKSCLGQFNHPPMPGRFQDYEMFPGQPGKDRVRLVEFNGGGSWTQKTNAYFTALDKGWEVSPSWNEDNHSRGWGDSPRATQIWAPKLSRGEVREAVLENRTVATNDDTASLKMLANGCWMGSKTKAPGDVSIVVTLADKQKDDGFGTVVLWGAKRKKLDTKDCNGKNPCTVTFTTKANDKTHFVVIARQTDDDVLVSGPVWYVK